MSDAQYMTAIGFVQFDPKPGEANNKPIRYISIQAAGSQKTIDVTVWDAHADVELKRGDLVTVQGKYNPKSKVINGKERTFHNLSASWLVKLGNGAGKSTGVANSDSGADAGEAPF